MAVETVSARKATLKLENGRDAKGVMTYVSTSLGSLSKDRWDADKALAIAAALAPCLVKDLGYVEGSSTYMITAS